MFIRALNCTARFLDRWAYRIRKKSSQVNFSANVICRKMSSGNEFASLITCEWLKHRIDRGNLDNLVILDVSWSSEKDSQQAYVSRHIPEARYLNVLVGPHSELFPRSLPAPEVFRELVRANGVSHDSHVILYSDSDAYGFFLSSRAWWTFKIFGAKHVSILNGGLKKWISLGYPTTSEGSSVKAGNFTPQTKPEYLLHFEQMKQLLGTATTVVDSRPSESYHAGHIPGAKNLFYKQLLSDTDMVMKPIEEVKNAFENVGVDFRSRFVTYCNTGMTSSTLAFAFAMCGGTDFALYHGGITEWKKKASDQIEN